MRSFLKNLHLLERIKPKTWQIACLTTSIVVVETFRAFLSSLMWSDVMWCDHQSSSDVSVCSEINGRATWELIGKSETIIWDHNEEALRKCAQYYSTLHMSIIVCKTRTLSVPQFVKGCCHLCEDSRFFGSHQNFVNLPRNSSVFSSQGTTSKKFRARGHSKLALINCLHGRCIRVDAVWEFSKTGNREQRLYFPIKSGQVGLTRIKFVMGIADSKG